eukprot:15337587-Alexandrium_andersonii.AAC.1
MSFCGHPETCKEFAMTASRIPFKWTHVRPITPITYLILSRPIATETIAGWVKRNEASLSAVFDVRVEWE